MLARGGRSRRSITRTGSWCLHELDARYYCSDRGRLADTLVLKLKKSSARRTHGPAASHSFNRAQGRNL
jgi:hypothetical protein